MLNKNNKKIKVKEKTQKSSEKKVNVTNDREQRRTVKKRLKDLYKPIKREGEDLKLKCEPTKGSSETNSKKCFDLFIDSYKELITHQFQT